MKHEIFPHPINCPYCAESFEILIDASIPHQKYIEDCEICCRPISFDVRVDEEGYATVNALGEEEDY